MNALEKEGSGVALVPVRMVRAAEVLDCMYVAAHGNVNRQRGICLLSHEDDMHRFS